MGKFTGKKQKLDYKPILYGGIIALPLLLLLILYLHGQNPIQTTFETGPTFTPNLSQAQMFIIRWTTNVPARGTVHYRFDPAKPYQTLATDLDSRGAIAIPAKPGQTIDFYIQAYPLSGLSVKSEIFQVKLLPTAPVTTAAADAKMSE
jgi:hypothetical protein